MRKQEITQMLRISRGAKALLIVPPFTRFTSKQSDGLRKRGIVVITNSVRAMQKTRGDLFDALFVYLPYATDPCVLWMCRQRCVGKEYHLLLDAWTEQ